MKKLFLPFIFLYTIMISSNCNKKKDAHIPPDISFKTGVTYTSGDRTIQKGDSIFVGITAVKTEDDLKSYNISYAYDGATTTITYADYPLTVAESRGYSNDTWIKTRSQAGSERWVFTILDRDGNIAQKKITLTVQ